MLVFIGRRIETVKRLIAGHTLQIVRGDFGQSVGFSKKSILVQCSNVNLVL